MKLLLIPIFVPFFISIRSFSSAFCVFLYIVMYILDIAKAIKRYQSETLSLKTFINELDFLKKAVINQ